MPLRSAVAAGVACLLLGASLGACFDLFHSTAGITTACQLDATACADGDVDAGDGGDGGPTDFCSWPSTQALQSAQHACAWLGACETPTGGNAFGPCMFAALLAYDCDANPAHRPRGAERALWDCLWQVGSCADVDRCLFPHGVPACKGTGTACATAAGYGDVRLACDGGVFAGGESCAMRGQTCAGGRCGGGFSPCTGADECNGSRLHRCVDGGDVGIDCASNGAGACGGFPTASSPSWVACVPSGEAGCTPSLSATCAGAVAYSCPSGIAETLDCSGLLLTTGSCVEGGLDPPFDWTSACAVVPPSCTDDSCGDGGLTGCMRGAAYTLDCASQGLGACRMVPPDGGTQMHAACSPP
jgi:hypothetical protein